MTGTEKIHEIRKLLRGVHFRQRQARGLDCLVRGAVAGGVGAVSIEVARLCGAPVAQAWPWLALFAAMMAAGVIGVMLPVSWRSTAQLVDQHYRMKDSTATALEFAERNTQDPFVHLQLAETIQCLHRIQPAAVVPLRVPKLAPAAVALCLVLISLPFLPQAPAAAVALDTGLQQVVNGQAETLDKTMVEELRELAEQTDDPELQELAAEIERLVEELKQPNVDQREVLAKLSEMQQALTKALEQFNPEKTAADLQELAAALESAQALQAISEALKEGNYDKAAEQLEKVDPNSLSRKEKDAVADNLKKFREKLAAGREGKLSEGAQDMQQGLEKENPTQFDEGASKAAAVFKSQALKKSISNSLNLQLNRLSESKGAHQSQRMAGGAPKKSEESSTKIGKAAANKPLGDEATKLDSQRRQESITGVQGEGQSERETSQSPDGDQDAARNYQKRYTEFRKAMEEVLENEPLPMGHRETVRKYFESIRPTAQDATE